MSTAQKTFKSETKQTNRTNESKALTVRTYFGGVDGKCVSLAVAGTGINDFCSMDLTPSQARELAGILLREFPDVANRSRTGSRSMNIKALRGTLRFKQLNNALRISQITSDTVGDVMTCSADVQRWQVFDNWTFGWSWTPFEKQ